MGFGLALEGTCGGTGRASCEDMLDKAESFFGKKQKLKLEHKGKTAMFSEALDSSGSSALGSHSKNPSEAIIMGDLTTWNGRGHSLSCRNGTVYSPKHSDRMHEGYYSLVLRLSPQQPMFELCVYTY